MSVRTTTEPGGSARAVEAGLLARLGLPANASTQQVETAHDELIGFLEQAPTELRSWAAREIDAIDEAYALLSDPTIDRSALAAEATAPVTAAATAKRQRATSQQAGASSGATAAPAPSARRRQALRAVIIAAALVGVVAIVIVGYNMGGPAVPGVAGSPDPAAAASPAVDTERVAGLMQKIQANPKDVESLQALADIYYLAGDFETAGGFLEKILTVDPQNLTARLALGAALFNLGKPQEAETHWRQVLSVDPDNLEAHYDLGFMYLSEKPSNLAQAKVEWARVVEIAPDSDVAKSIEQHLASLDASPAPGPALAAPTSGTSTAPATSPAPSGN